MAKTYEPSDYIMRVFYIGMAGVGAFIAAVFLFIL